MVEKSLSKKLSSFQIIIIGFMATILVGAVILMLPISSADGSFTPFLKSLFTSTSAVCVTGLVVFDTALHWSIFGQIVIIILIQLGGIGIISVIAFVATIAGRNISLRERSMLADTMSAHQIGGIVNLTKFIFKIVFITEIIGALLMMPVFCGEFGLKGIWMSAFHSVSAFCNAGFDIMGQISGSFNSLTFYATNPVIVIVISLLIIFGGIGFLTWQDIIQHKYHIKRYRMQSKVILATSLVLIIVPTIFFFFAEFGKYPFGERLALSFFQAVTPRTAGFNTANLPAMTGVGKALMIILMLIGGSPGSTAGGIKTTTFAVMLASSHAFFFRKKSTVLFGRRIEGHVIRHASTLLILYGTLTVVGASILSLSESLPMATCLFEAASAIGTVGLTLGITPGLGPVSQIVLIILMFLGRVGGVTIIFAAIKIKGTEVSRSPVEKIMVG